MPDPSTDPATKAAIEADVQRMAAITPTRSDEGDDLGEKGERALDAWKQRAKAAESEAKRARTLEAQLKAIEDKDKTEGEKLAARTAAAETEAASARTEYLRLKVATSKGLPSNLADRLRGTTEEEMVADADELLAVFKPKGAAPRSFDGGARSGSAPRGGSFLADAIRKRNS